MSKKALRNTSAAETLPASAGEMQSESSLTGSVRYPESRERLILPKKYQHHPAFQPAK